jgi:hypothetical protein
MKSTFRWPPSGRPAVSDGFAQPSWADIFPGVSGAAFLLRMLALCIEGLISKKSDS